MRRLIWITGVLCLAAVLGADRASALPLAPAAPQDTAKKQGGGKATKKDGDSAATAKDGATKPKKKKDAAETSPVEDSIRLAKRVEKSTSRPLFATRQQLPFTLIANFGRIMRDRDSTSTRRFEGTLVVLDDAGKEARIPVKVRTRGHFRLRQSTCRFVPLRVEFPDSGLKGTPFQGQKSLKLGTHCQGDGTYEQYVMKEYLAYRIYNTITDRSFRARLAKGTYVDSASGKTVDSRTALWIESEDDLGGRLGGKVKELKGALFDDVDAETIDRVALFEYAIGNSDWSLFALHNIRVVQGTTGAIYPVPYDFDFSGLVNTRYSSPDPRLPIDNVRQRLYRGPCRSLEQLQPAVALFVERRGDIMELFKEVPGLRGAEAEDAREYLDDFFRVAQNPREVKSQIVAGCQKKPGV